MEIKSTGAVTPALLNASECYLSDRTHKQIFPRQKEFCSLQLRFKEWRNIQRTRMGFRSNQSRSKRCSGRGMSRSGRLQKIGMNG
jgi:hypothetical protein